MKPSRHLIRRPRLPPATIVAVRKAGGPSVAVTLATSAVLVLAVALVDYATGTELRVFPLYFLPILAVSLRLGRWPGLGTAVACALAWGLSNRLAGMRGSRPAIGLANLLVMAIAFAAIALLGAAQREWLRRERAISRTDSLTGLLNGRGFYEAAAVGARPIDPLPPPADPGLRRSRRLQGDQRPVRPRPGRRRPRRGRPRAAPRLPLDRPRRAPGRRRVRHPLPGDGPRRGGGGPRQAALPGAGG